jgi:CRP/FNR family cyclic AMP-dependent transcriptional regulator
VVFAVSRTEDAGSAPVRESSITMVMTRREKEKVEGIEKPREKDKDVDFILQHLKKIELFSPLPEASLEKMIPVLELKRFADSTPIIQQGEKGKYLFILIKGSVEVVQKTAEGFENVLATLSKGEVFGEMSLISGEPCSATVKASSPVSVLTISKENFDRILSENPSLNIYFNQLLVQRLRKQNVHVDEEISRGMLGKLSTFTLPELAQAISMNSRTGTLVLYNQDLRGEILFRNGQVVDAVSGALKAEEAFFDLLTWKDGNFRFKPGDIAAQRVVRMDTMGLLMEGLRRLDEKKMKA